MRMIEILRKTDTADKISNLVINILNKYSTLSNRLFSLAARHITLNESNLQLLICRPILMEIPSQCRMVGVTLPLLTY